MRISKRTLLLFDIDGTLIDGDGAGRRAFDRACLEIAGIQGALDGLKLDGMTDPLLLAHAFEKHRGRAPTDEETRAVFARYVAHLETEVAASSSYTAKAGAHAAVDAGEQRGAAIGLATGNLEGGARIKLQRSGLWPRFAFGGYGSDGVKRAELVAVGIARGRAHRPDVDDVWIIGDTPLDVEGAHAAGARAVGVASGRFSVDDLRRANADLAYPTLEEFVAALVD